LLAQRRVTRRVAVCAASDVTAYVQADPQRLKQVLVNLVSNAIKYNRRGGTVRLWWAVNAEGRGRLLVSDTGEGLSPEQIARLFQPFERLGGRGVEGTGLGLVLSKGLVELMGGTLGVESTPGDGSTFWVELPRAAPPPAVAPPAVIPNSVAQPRLHSRPLTPALPTPARSGLPTRAEDTGGEWCSSPSVLKGWAWRGRGP
jgi:signal transduction histidine kinase